MDNGTAAQQATSLERRRALRKSVWVFGLALLGAAAFAGHRASQAFGQFDGARATPAPESAQPGPPSSSPSAQRAHDEAMTAGAAAMGFALAGLLAMFASSRLAPTPTHDDR